MNTPLTNQPLNSAQNQHLIALAANVSDSMRTGMILLILAVARLGQQVDAPKQLAGMTCKQIFAWIARTPHGCSYEAVRKLLKSLVETGLAEFCKGRYTLADSVVSSLRKLADAPASSAAEAATGVPGMAAPYGPGSPATQSGQFLPSSVPGGAAAMPVAVNDAATDETNKKAIDYFVDITALHSRRPRSSLYWQVACCRTGSVAQLAAAASGLATELMSGRGFLSPVGELQAVLDGKSAIKPTSAASFVFAYEAYTRESAAEAKTQMMAPFVNAALEMLGKRLAPPKPPVADPEKVDSASTSPVPPSEEERPLATIYKLPVPGDYGDAA